jgi:metal-responsive CopG/Arc/MetJ family transcriptional regulator
VPTAKSRVQVTIDEELADALAGVDAAPASRSRLVRDLALRGARALREDHDRALEARAVLLAIANGGLEHDFDAVAEALERRGERLP